MARHRFRAWQPPANPWSRPVTNAEFPRHNRVAESVQVAESDRYKYRYIDGSKARGNTLEVDSVVYCACATGRPAPVTMTRPTWANEGASREYAEQADFDRAACRRAPDDHRTDCPRHLPSGWIDFGDRRPDLRRGRHSATHIPPPLPGQGRRGDATVPSVRWSERPSPPTRPAHE